MNHICTIITSILAIENQEFGLIFTEIERYLCLDPKWGFLTESARSKANTFKIIIKSSQIYLYTLLTTIVFII